MMCPAAGARRPRLAMRLGALALVLLMGGLARAAATPSPIGLWLTQDQDGVIEIAQCGAVLCGRIVGLGRFAPDGSATRDVHGVSDCGLALMTGMKPIADNLWRGNIYDPENGATYDAQFRVDPQGRLRLRGFIFLPLFGSTQVWTRYTGKLTEDCHMSRG